MNKQNRNTFIVAENKLMVFIWEGDWEIGWKR